MKSRTENAKLNIIIGIISQVLILVMTFLGRKIFLLYMSIEYLGINGLYSSILSVLSLAELGLGSVVSYSLYKPVQDNNREQICALVSFFKKIYLVIAFVITVVGLMLIPFLKYIVTSNLSQRDLIIYYLLFLLNSVATYFVAHDVSLLIAYQENRIHKIITLIGSLGTEIAHIIILIVIPNYVVYVSATVLNSFLTNTLFAYITHKKYSYLRIKEKSSKDYLESKGVDVKILIKKMKSGILYKFSCVILNSTDNLLISILVSTAAVGLYSNYSSIITAAQLLLGIVTTSIISAVGNLNAENNPKRMFEMFNGLTLSYHLISCFVSLSMFWVFNPFIALWLGKEFTLSPLVVFSIALNFFVTQMTTPIWSFREATGQFEKAKYIMCVAAILNIILSIIMGYSWGLSGILIATSVAKVLTMFWYEPMILFKNVFHQKIVIYWKHQFKYFICAILSSILTWSIVRLIVAEGIVYIVTSVAICGLICFGVYGILNVKSNEMKTILKIFCCK